MSAPAFLMQRSQNNLRNAFDQHIQANDVRAMAEQGAMALEQLGPHGQYWAAQLRNDPRAAMSMAEDYGGIAQIAAALQLQQAQAAGAAPMQQLQQIASTPGMGPAAAQAFGVGVQGVGAGQRSQAEAMTEMMYPGGQGKIPGFGWEQVQQRRREFERGATNWKQQRQAWTAANAGVETAIASGNHGLADVALINALVRMLDPGSVVRESEAGMVIEASSSQLAGAIQDVMSKLGLRQGLILPQSRARLYEFIYGQAVKQEQAYQQEYNLAKQDVMALPLRPNEQHLRRAMLPAQYDPANKPITAEESMRKNFSILHDQQVAATDDNEDGKKGKTFGGLVVRGTPEAAAAEKAAADYAAGKRSTPTVPAFKLSAQSPLPKNLDGMQPGETRVGDNGQTFKYHLDGQMEVLD